jgi:hypothetical protein
MILILLEVVSLGAVKIKKSRGQIIVKKTLIKEIKVKINMILEKMSVLHRQKHQILY